MENMNTYLAVLILTGSIIQAHSFLFLKKPSANSETVSQGQDERDEFRRYWNDEEEMCISNKCGHLSPNDKAFVSCLKQYCHRSIVTTRDEDGVEASPSAPPDYWLACHNRCKNFRGAMRYVCFTSCVKTAKLSTAGKLNAAEVDLSVVKCGLDKCKGLIGTALLACVKRKCYQYHGPKASEKKQLDNQILPCMLPCAGQRGPKLLTCINIQCRTGPKKRMIDQSDVPLALKRRYNDPVAHCMLSYCGGKNGMSKIRCIANSCNRRGRRGRRGRK